MMPRPRIPLRWSDVWLAVASGVALLAWLFLIGYVIANLVAAIGLWFFGGR